MKIPLRNLRVVQHCAFTLIEVMFAVALIAVAVTALYFSISSGFQVIETARENLRATQIMVERLETIRLYRWEQVTNSSFVDPKFTNFYNHVTQSGFTYNGKITIQDLPPSESYATDMREITIELSWISAKIPRNRSMRSLIAKRGIQNYVY